MGVTSIVAAGKRLVAQTLLDRGVRLKRTEAGDGMGGTTVTFVPTGRPFPARYGQLNEADSAGRQARGTYGQLEGVAGGVLLVPLGTVLEEGDRVRDPASGRTWSVMGEATPPSALAVVRRLYTREV